MENRMNGKLSYLISLFLSVYLSGSIILSSKIHYKDVFTGLQKEFVSNLTLKDFGYFLLLVFLLNLISSKVATFIKKSSMHFTLMQIDNASVNSRKYFYVVLFLLIAWFPYFICFFPGTATVDEIFMMRYTYTITNQPILYSLLLRLFWNIGITINHETWGLGVLNFLNQFIMAGALSYLLYRLRLMGLPRWYILLNLFLFAFLPIFPNYAICFAKDKLFFSFFVLYIFMLYDYYNIQRKNEKFSNFKIAIFLLSSIMIVMLRGNGIYIYLANLLCMLSYSVTKRKTLVSVSILLIISGLVCVIGKLPSTLVKNIYHRQMQSSEAMGVPLQQIGRVIAKNKEISEVDMIYLNNIINLKEWKKVYSTASIDPVKYNPNFNHKYFDEHKQEFILTYLSLLKRYPKIYIDAFLLETFGYWGLTKWDSRQTLFVTSLNRGSLNLKNENDMISRNIQYSDNHLFPIKLKNKIGNFMIKGNIYFPAGICVWIYFFIVLICIKLHKVENAIFTVPLFICWSTVMLAAPIAFAFRYMLGFAFLMPLIFCLPFINFSRR